MARAADHEKAATDGSGGHAWFSVPDVIEYASSLILILAVVSLLAWTAVSKPYVVGGIGFAVAGLWLTAIAASRLMFATAILTLVTTLVSLMLLALFALAPTV